MQQKSPTLYTATSTTLYLPFNDLFFRWTSVSRYRNASILEFIGANDNGDDDSWICKAC